MLPGATAKPPAHSYLSVVSLSLFRESESAKQGCSIAHVPFDFLVGSESMPAGQYTVRSSNAQGDVLRITSTDMTKDVVRLSSALYGQSSKPKLVFHRYGDRYFLAEIWDGDQGRMLIKSKQERAAQRELARTEKSSQTAKASFERIEVLAQVQ